MALMRRRSGVLGMVLAAATVLGPSAQAPSPDFQFAARTDLITLDVTVLDNDRRPVRGLTADAFTIVDGGVEVPVAAFSAVELPPSTPVRSTAADAVAPDVAGNEAADGRLVMIMFDHSIPAGWGAEAARRIARSVVDQLGRDDRAAIVFSDRALSQSFTSDRARLLEAIDSPVVGTTIGQAKLDVDGNWMPEDQTGLCYCGLCSFDTITNVAESVASVSNRKKVLFFIGGYLPLNLADRGIDKSLCQIYLPPAIARMFETAQRANLTIYAFDPNGLTAGDPAGLLSRLATFGGQQPASNTQTLLAATDATGGRTIYNTNAPEERVVEVFEETQSYYLLGFAPSADAEAGSFRNITVRVNRPDTRILTRRGYYVPAAAEPDDAVDTDPLLEALQDLMPRSTIPMQLSIGAFPDADGAVTLAVTMGVDREDAAPLEVLAAGFDRTGRLVDSSRHTIAPEVEIPTANTDEVFTQLSLPRPGGYHVRVAVRDTATGHIASVHDTVDAPDFGREPLTISNLLVHTSRVRFRSTSALADFLPIVPTTRRVFEAGETVTVYAQVTQTGTPIDLPVTARVFDSTGTALLDRADVIEATTFAAGPTFYRFDLPLARLEPGEYLLTVNAERDAVQRTRTIRFEVQ